MALAVAIAATVAAGALADTVHLKNGRVIRTPRAWVVGDQLRFLQYGQEITIPMVLVDRVVEDESAGPGPTEAPPPADEDAGDAASESSADEGEPAQEDEVPPEETREYWEDRVRAIRDERTELEEALVELRREERAFLFAHRSTAETRRQIEAVQQRLEELDEALSDLRREARRAGIPPGWIRV